VTVACLAGGVCTTEQTLAPGSDRIISDTGIRKVTDMLLTLSALISLTAVLVITKVWLPAPASVSSLGLMSEQWLAEQRATRTR
jgi:hypothetical protein